MTDQQDHWMRMDVGRSWSGRQRTAESRKSAGRRARRAFRHLAFGCAVWLAFIQTAQAMEIYYARAIGQDFLPDTTTPAPPPASAKEAPKPAAPELPALGTTTDAKVATTGETSLWTKILIGVVVVGAIAALGNRGGGASDEVNASTAPAPAPSSSPPAGGGFNIGIGGGGKGKK